MRCPHCGKDKGWRLVHGVKHTVLLQPQKVAVGRKANIEWEECDSSYQQEYAYTAIATTDENTLKNMRDDDAVVSFDICLACGEAIS